MDVDKNDVPEYISFKVLGHDHATTSHYKIKRHTLMKKLMTVYSLRTGLSMHTLRFRFDGQVVNEDSTASSLEMEEGDIIEVYQEQIGGFN